MSVYLLETWTIKPEDKERHDLIWKRYVRYMNQNPELFASIKSMKIYEKLLGNTSITHAQIVEFDSLEDKEILDHKLSQDRESGEFHRKLMRVKDPATTTEIICEPFLEFR